MDIFEKIIRDNSWRFPKGYPDVSNPKDKEFLISIAEHVLEQQLNLFSDDVLDQMKVDLKITDDDFDTEKELRSILNKADSRVKTKYKLDDPEMFEKIVNGIMNARLQPELLDLLRRKGYNKIILDRYATELSAVFNSVADKDRDKFINYITSDNQKKFSKSPSGKIKDEIASTGIDFEDDAVFDSLIKFTTQDEKKLGVGMGELALAMLFKNIGAASKKGDLTLDNEEFEIKGYGAKLGRDPSGFQVKADNPFLKDLGLVKIEKGTEENPGTRDIMKVGKKIKQLNSLSDVLSDLYDVVPDKEKFVEAFKNMLKDENGADLPSKAVDSRTEKIDWDDAESINTNIGLMNFIRYAEEENFPHFLVHDMGQAKSAPNSSKYVYASGDPYTMADQLYNRGVKFENTSFNNLNPRIVV